jgi:hypothetical protein
MLFSNEQSPNGVKQVTHEVDVCVVGGGMPGLAAALAAARHGASVVLMHERPVLGGNASSEIRIHICGADRHNSIKHMRETGILEELRLENLHRNPLKNFSIWDTILYETAMLQPGLTTLLNCSCLQAEMQDDTITSVTGWQLTTETYQTVRAKIFIDCSGDAILAPLTGAQFNMGREGRAEYGESIAPVLADNHTMGMSAYSKRAAMIRHNHSPRPPGPTPSTMTTFPMVRTTINGGKWATGGWSWAGRIIASMIPSACATNC